MEIWLHERVPFHVLTVRCRAVVVSPHRSRMKSMNIHRRFWSTVDDNQIENNNKTLYMTISCILHWFIFFFRISCHLIAFSHFSFVWIDKIECFFTFGMHQLVTVDMRTQTACLSLSLVSEHSHFFSLGQYHRRHWNHAAGLYWYICTKQPRIANRQLP